MVEDEEFRELVVRDAQSIRGRQETDTIDIIDEIRYFLKTDLNSMSALQEAQQKLEAIDIMLSELGFEI